MSVTYKEFKKIYNFFIVDKNGVLLQKESNDVIIAFVPFEEIANFVKLMRLQSDLMSITLKSDCIAFNLVPFLERLDIEPSDIFEDL